MGLAQGNFDRARISAIHTLTKLKNSSPELGRTHSRELRAMLHDLDQIAAAIRLELMNRDE